MEYLAAHAGYTRVHNPRTGEKDLLRLPGLVAVAYQHETSRCGDPHLHTHVIVPNRQARADGQMVSIDGTSLYHEAKAAGVIYQATLRRELHQSMGFEWSPVDPSTGMAELAGVDRDTITAWSRRSTQLREWAANNLTVVDVPLSAAQLATARVLYKLRGGDPFAIAQKLHPHITIEDCRNHLQSAAAGILIDAAALDRDTPRTSVQQQYWHRLTLIPPHIPSRHKFVASPQIRKGEHRPSIARPTARCTHRSWRGRQEGLSRQAFVSLDT
jgi:TrwC relaxase